MKKENGYINQFPGRNIIFGQDKFMETYKRLIYEWAKELNTPNELLENIKRKMVNYTDQYSWIIEYDYNHLFKLITSKYRWFKIWKHILNQNIKIRFFYYKDTFDPLLTYYTNDTVQSMKELKDIKAACLYSNNNLQRGCMIYLNGNMININDNNELEFNLDHELNHYFTEIKNIIKPDNINDITNIDQRLEIVAERAGFHTKTQDFLKHIYSKNQFISMCSEVCNYLNIEPLSKDQIYYKWLDQSTAKFIMSKSFSQISINYQNIILFSYACRVLSKQRWKKLKDYVYKQLDQPKKNIFKDSLNSLRDLFIKIF